MSGLVWIRTHGSYVLTYDCKFSYSFGLKDELPSIFLEG